MGPAITADLVEDALRMALYEREPNPGLLHHSDRGSQYASSQIRQSGRQSYSGQYEPDRQLLRQCGYRELFSTLKNAS